MRLIVGLLAWAALAGSAEAASIPGWPAKCEILRSAAEWAADLPRPFATGEIDKSPNGAFNGHPGLAESLGSPTPNLTDYLPWPNKHCGTKDARPQGVEFFFGEPLVDLDFAAVDLEQHQGGGEYGGGARNRTRIVLQRTEGRWRVISGLTYESRRLPVLQIDWPRAPRSDRRSSAPEPRSSPES
jgi:hypothetical protein